MHRLAIFITDFGDSAVTMPLAAVTTVFLLGLRRSRLALGWAVSIIACAAVIGGLKLFLAGCSHRLGLVDLTSPSGHVAISTAVYGGFVILLGDSLAPLQRRTALLGAALGVAGIAVTRLILHEHSIAEIAVGLTVGLTALAAFRAVLAAAPPGRLPVFWLCVAAVATMALMHGTRWRAERAIHSLAGLGLFHALFPWCG